MKKTKAIEILDQEKIEYRLGEFTAVDYTAEEVAAKLTIPLNTVFKTLIARAEKKGVVVAVIPGDRELSLKKLAHVLNEKRAEMVKVDELLRLTGYLKGGCSPLGMKRQYPTFLDQSASVLQEISISAGLRGLQILISPQSLVKVAGAALADLAD